MRLEKYITEEISQKSDVMPREKDKVLDDTLTLLERDCQKFIKETGGFLWRSTKGQSNPMISKVKTRTDRRPVDTKKRIHDMANVSFKKKFGWKVRSEGVFTATTPEMTKGYGDVIYMVFPIGNYKYVWSWDSYDFFVTQSQVQSKNRWSGDQFTEEEMDKLVEQYTDKNLSKAWDDYNGREIVFNCPNGYYLVNAMMVGELSYYLNIER